MNAQATERIFYQFSPILPIVAWWQISLLALMLVVLVAFAALMIRRDTRNLPRGLAFLLLGLRLLAIGGIVLFIANLQLRSETQITRTSRLAVLIDTSLSMGLKDQALGESQPTLDRRIDEVVKSLKSRPTLARLCEEHDVFVYAFGDQDIPQQIAEFPRSKENEIEAAIASDRWQVQLERSRPIGWSALGILLMSGLLFVSWIVSLTSGNSPEVRSWRLAAALLVLMAAVVLIGVCDLTAPSFSFLTSLGISNPDLTSVEVSPTTSPNEAFVAKPAEIDWVTELNPSGTSTRLGSAIQALINKERGGPIAGIVVISDGRNNGGLIPSRAIAAAANASIPLFPVGIGSTTPPRNIQIADIQAPPRVFPGDNFRIKGLLQSFGLEGKTVRVELLSVDEKEKESPVSEADAMVRLEADGKPAQVEFEISRAELGKRRYIVRAEAIDGELDARDNSRSAVVEIVDRKTVVLLMAGGPSREFRFLRNQLFRDKDVELHVWLQSAKQGADQESDVLLEEFPQTREGVFAYDCVVAFDPDWRDLDANQADLLERWVAEKAGGLLVVAGPVNTPEWTRRPRGDQAIDIVRRLYPVSFYSAGSAVLKLGRFGGESPYPLEFTREGRAAEYLWIGDSASESAATWGNFEGVFGYYAVNEAKPGADVLAYFADASTSIDDRLPIYFASQFYGAGRVFFQASGEMWRVRKLDVEYFENHYLKLIRWLSQGRLLRDSTRGVLISDRERCWMGDQVKIQAILSDAQDQPLVLPEVLATITEPNGKSRDLMLRSAKEAVRPGTFSASFNASQEGEYRISVPIPDSPEFEVLSTSVQVSIPNLEKEQPVRNDALLSELAEKTQGHYFVGMKEWDVERDDPLSPLQLIAAQDQQTFLPGTPDRQFRRKLMMWLLVLISLALALEWTSRRLHKLA